MTNFFVRKSSLQGSITIPPSKSQTLRAILFASLAKGKSEVVNYLNSPDTHAMINACRSLGAQIEVFPNHMKILGIGGKIHGADNVIDAGNSGIILRFITALAGLSDLPIVVTGDHSIRNQRPMHSLLDGLSQLGVSAVSTRNNGYAPCVIQGPWIGGKTRVSGQDSQPISALLIAASLAPNETEIFVKNPGEKPWVDLTLFWLDKLGLPYKRVGYSHYIVPGKGSYEGFSYHVPGDFSSAAYPLVAALITNSEITIENIDIDDPQGDKELVYVLQQMGANIEIEPRRLVVKKGSKLQGKEIDINNYIDAITILAVVGCFAEGETKIVNAAIAAQKECNRIQCITQELKKMGASITAHEEGLVVQKSSLRGATVLSYQDQRMALSLAVAGLAAEGLTEVCDVEWAAKTFPSFREDFLALGASI